MTVSIRLAWSFWRVLPNIDAELAMLREENLSVDALADASLRIDRQLAARLLAVSLRTLGDGLLGLRAGLSVDPSD